MEWATLLQPKRLRESSSVTKMSDDIRSDFKKDFDTVCNCTGIRRLQDKAQVFPLEKEDYARTRLTHSIEVMSIAESLGVAAVGVIATRMSTSPTMELVNDIPVILRTAALLHDMGNPPFGHLGEEIIGDWFKEYLPQLRFTKGEKVIFSKTHSDDSERLLDLLSDQMKNDLLHFEGNAQLLRLVTKLSYVVDDNGMNLSFPVLATIIKYPTSSNNISSDSLLTKKMGYMYAEMDIFNKINQVLGLNGKRHPLVFLLEAADDIAYLTADIEDAHKKGIINLNDIIKIFERQNNDPFVSDVLNEYKKYEEKCSELQYTEHDNYIMQRLRIFLKGKMISAVKEAFNLYYDDIMNGTFAQELLSVSSAATIVSLIRNDIEYKHIYYCNSIIKTKLQSYEIIDSLLTKFVPCVFNAQTDKMADDKDTLLYALISSNYKYICEKKVSGLKYNSQDRIYNKLLLVTDYISGMTDTYAKDMFHLLTANDI